MDDPAFAKEASRALSELEDALDALSDAALDWHTGDGTLKISIAGAKDCFLFNRQGAAKQIWLSALGKAWHFAPDPKTGAFVATSLTPDQAGQALLPVVSKLLSQRLGRPVPLAH